MWLGVVVPHAKSQARRVQNRCPPSRLRQVTQSPLLGDLLRAFCAGLTTATHSMQGHLGLLGGLGQVLVAGEVVTEDDTVGCDLVLARGWVMGAAAGFENGQCAFEPGVSSEELEQDHVVG